MKGNVFFEIGGQNFTAYELMIIIGLVAAFFVFYFFCKRLAVDKKAISFYEVALIASIFLGFLGAVLFQSIFMYIKYRAFAYHGMTFLGGLFCGIGAFFLIYKLFAPAVAQQELRKLLSFAPLSIMIAHSFGRVGCFFGGCCYGHEADWGVQYEALAHRVVPTNLFEAIFLAIFFAVMMYLVLQKKYPYALETYLVGYGIFRFVLEFFRGDERGALFFFMSPAQTLCVIMIVVGFVLLIHPKCNVAVRQKGKSND